MFFHQKCHVTEPLNFDITLKNTIEVSMGKKVRKNSSLQLIKTSSNKTKRKKKEGETECTVYLDFRVFGMLNNWSTVARSELTRWKVTFARLENLKMEAEKKQKGFNWN